MEHPDHVLDAFEVIIHEDAFVGRVVVGVRVPHAHANRGHAVLSAHQILRTGAGHVRQHEWLVAVQLAGGFDDHRRDRRVRVRARRSLAFPFHLRHLDVGKPLLDQMLAQQVQDLLRILVGHQPEVQLRRRLRRQDRLATRPLVAAGQATDRARWIE